jgi:hypothetical protein
MPWVSRLLDSLSRKSIHGVVGEGFVEIGANFGGKHSIYIWIVASIDCVIRNTPAIFNKAATALVPALVLTTSLALVLTLAASLTHGALATA